MNLYKITEDKMTMLNDINTMPVDKITKSNALDKITAEKMTVFSNWWQNDETKWLDKMTRQNDHTKWLDKMTRQNDHTKWLDKMTRQND